MEEVCHLYKASCIQWFLPKEALFLGSFLLTYNSTSNFHLLDCVKSYSDIMQNISLHQMYSPNPACCLCTIANVQCRHSG